MVWERERLRCKKLRHGEWSVFMVGPRHATCSLLALAVPSSLLAARQQAALVLSEPAQYG